MMERRVKERLIGATVLVVLIVLIVPEMLSGPRQPSAPPLTAGLPAPTRSVSVDLATSQATAEPDFPEGASATPAAPASAASASAASQGAASQGAATDPASGSASPPAAGGQGASEGAPVENSAPESAPTVTTLKAQEPSEAALETPASAPKSALGGSRNASSDAGAGQQGHRGWSVQLGSFASRANAERLVHQLQARGGSPLYVSASGSGPSLRYRVRVGPLADRGAAERAAGKFRAAGHPATIVTPSS